MKCGLRASSQARFPPNLPVHRHPCNPTPRLPRRSSISSTASSASASLVSRSPLPSPSHSAALAISNRNPKRQRKKPPRLLRQQLRHLRQQLPRLQQPLRPRRLLLRLPPLRRAVIPPPRRSVARPFTCRFALPAISPLAWASRTCSRRSPVPIGPRRKRPIA